MTAFSRPRCPRCSGWFPGRTDDKSSAVICQKCGRELTPPEIRKAQANAITFERAA